MFWNVLAYISKKFVSQRTIKNEAQNKQVQKQVNSKQVR